MDVVEWVWCIGWSRASSKWMIVQGSGNGHIPQGAASSGKDSDIRTCRVTLIDRVSIICPENMKFFEHTISVHVFKVF